MKWTQKLLDWKAKAEAGGLIRVLSKFEVSDFEVVDMRGRSDVVYGCIVDTETTGTNHQEDEVIELGVVKIAVRKSDSAFLGVVGWYASLREPSKEIDAEAQRVHGISMEDVKGKVLDVEGLEEMLDGCAFVIAHNAAFDRPFCEKLHPKFLGLHWMCSVKELEWLDACGVSGDELVITGAKLEYLAFKFGFFYEAHRADTDCGVLLKVLTDGKLKTGESLLSVLLKSGRRRTYRLYAFGAPFDKKDALKEAGFRWNPTDKVWHMDVGVDDRDGLLAVLDMLHSQVFRGSAVKGVLFRELSAKQRYSTQEEKVDVQRISFTGVIEE